MATTIDAQTRVPVSEWPAGYKKVVWGDGTIHRIQDYLPNAKEAAITAVIGLVALPIIASIGTVVCLAKSLYSAAQIAKHHIEGNKDVRNQAYLEFKDNATWTALSAVSILPGASLAWLIYYLRDTMASPNNPDCRMRDFGRVV